MFSRAGCGGRRRTDGAQDRVSLGRGEVGRDRRRLPRTREAALPCLWPSLPLVVCTVTLGRPHVGSRTQGAMALDGGALAFSCGAGEAHLLSSVLEACFRSGRSESGRTPELGRGGQLSLPAGQVLGGVGPRWAAVWCGYGKGYLAKTV